MAAGAGVAMWAGAAALLAAQAAAGEHAAVALTPGWAEAGGARVAGLAFDLAPGWKTYWRAPGEAGVPPSFDWSGSTNLAAVSVEWPVPEVFESYGMMTLGYLGAVTLPLRLEPVDPAQPLGLRLAIDYGMCADICVLEQATLALDIAPGAAAEGAAAVRSALARTPLTPDEAGLSAIDCALSGAGEMRVLEARLAFDAAFAQAPLVVIEGPPGVWFAPAQVRAEGGVLAVRADAQVHDGPGWIGRDDLRLTVLGAAFAVDVRGCRAARG